LRRADDAMLRQDNRLASRFHVSAERKKCSNIQRVAARGVDRLFWRAWGAAHLDHAQASGGGSTKDHDAAI